MQATSAHPLGVGVRAPDDDAGPLDEEAGLAADEHRQGALARQVTPRRRRRSLLEPTFAPINNLVMRKRGARARRN